MIYCFFLSLCDPEKEVLRYVGRLLLKSTSKPSEILKKLNEMAGYDPDEEIELCQEVWFNPNDLWKPIDKKLTFHASELQDGDIVGFWKAPATDNEEHVSHPDVPSNTELEHNGQDAMMNQQRAMGNDSFGPMMYARLPMTVNYMDPATNDVPSYTEFVRNGQASISGSETDSKGPRNLDQIKIPGLKPSMSMSDFIGQNELCLSEQMTSGNPPFSAGGSEYQEILEDIAQQLLNDDHVAAASDEKSLMSRVNSLCCLLQKDPVAVPNSHLAEDSVEGPDDGKDVKPAEEDSKDASGGKQALGMSRKDSFSDLLLQLPQIASLPKFLFNISEEDGDSQAR